VILPGTRALRKKRTVSKKAKAPAGPRVRFLIIDDEVNILRAFTMYFEDSGIEIVTARSGREGVATFREHGAGVILCDLGMDDMNGWEVSEAIKNYCDTEGIPKPPFLIYTGWDPRMEPEQLSQRGVDRVVTKPVPYDELLRIVVEETSKRKVGNKKLVSA
jgi:CheY-like chemotaxis protein